MMELKHPLWSKIHRSDRLDMLLTQVALKSLDRKEFWRIYEAGQGRLRVLTVNLEILRGLLNDSEPLDSADYCTVDSAFLNFLLCRYQGGAFERLTGREILATAPFHVNHRRLVILGASKESREAALKLIRGLAGGAFAADGYEDPADAITAGEVAFSAPAAIFFAYGYPKQEYIIEALQKVIAADRDVLMIGVGGAVDYLSGSAVPPPAAVASLGLEWLWRLLLNPRYRGPRILRLIPFAFWLLFQLLLQRIEYFTHVKRNV
ncbi:MAG: WecB/TagA/CpsF family glycosyltransferase [Brevundimonas sp.]|nr:WecB/TagA/CpsF family glycosyltransferase [Brevundimonas sp.]